MSVWDAKKPKRQSMLWGRSDLAEKFYSGEKSSNPWVRDLLWKKNITDEHKKFSDDTAIDLVPPHMRSVTLANVSASIRQKEKRRHKLMMQQQADKMYQRPQTSSGYERAESVRSYRSNASRRSRRSQQQQLQLQEGEQYLPPLQSHSRSPSARSMRSYRSVGSLGSNASLSRFTELLQRQNAKLENDIMTQKVERQRLEKKISNLESLVKTSVVRSTVSQQRTEKRLKAYKIIVDKLARAASRRELR